MIRLDFWQKNLKKKEQKEKKVKKVGGKRKEERELLRYKIQSSLGVFFIA